MSKPTVVRRVAHVCATVLRSPRVGGGRERGASFPEILLAVGLFSLLATFIVPPVMQWFQQSEVTRTIRSDCQVVILDAMRTGGQASTSGTSKDCATPGTAVPAAPASTASTASAASAAAR